MDWLVRYLGEVDIEEEGLLRVGHLDAVAAAVGAPPLPLPAGGGGRRVDRGRGTRPLAVLHLEAPHALGYLLHRHECWLAAAPQS